MALITPWDDALFCWRVSLFRRDHQVGAECTIFRNESRHLSSAMILEAERLAWAKWPGQRLYTAVGPAEVAGTNPGYCFLMARWRRCGKSESGKLWLEKLAK